MEGKRREAAVEGKRREAAVEKEKGGDSGGKRMEAVVEGREREKEDKKSRNLREDSCSIFHLLSERKLTIGHFRSHVLLLFYPFGFFFS